MKKHISSDFSVPGYKMPLEVLYWIVAHNFWKILVSTFLIVAAIFLFNKIGYLDNVFLVGLVIFGCILLVSGLMFLMAYNKLKISYLQHQKKRYNKDYADLINKAGSGNHAYEPVYKSRLDFFSDRLQIELARKKRRKVKGVPNHPIRDKNEIPMGT